MRPLAGTFIRPYNFTNSETAPLKDYSNVPPDNSLNLFVTVVELRSHINLRSKMRQKEIKTVILVNGEIMRQITNKPRRDLRAVRVKFSKMKTLAPRKDLFAVKLVIQKTGTLLV